MTNSQQNNPVKEILQVDKELLDNISHLIEDQAVRSILNILAGLHSADIGEIINHLDRDEAHYIFSLLDAETAGEVITELNENLRERILKKIDEQRITDIVDELDTDDATDILSDLPEDVAQHVLENIDREDSADVKELLKYDEDTAGGIMTSDFVYVTDTATVKDAIEEVRENADEYDHIYYIYVLTDTEKLIGSVSLKSLLINPLSSNITTVMDEDLIYVTPNVDQEEVARMIEKYDLVAIPVVDENKKMLGRITIDDVVDVIHEEASEDIQKIAGLSEEQESSDTVFRISRIRLPWLMIGLVMELVNALLISSYQGVIQQYVIASFFIPVIMAVGGSSGQQAAIVMVKGISSSDFWLNESIKKLSKEFFVAILNGIACGLLLIALTSVFFHDDVTLKFSFLLAITLLVIISFATMVGATIPIILKRFNVDPAIATGPVVSTSNDIFGLLIYFTFITLFYIQ